MTTVRILSWFDNPNIMWDFSALLLFLFVFTFFFIVFLCTIVFLFLLLVRFLTLTRLLLKLPFGRTLLLLFTSCFLSLCFLSLLCLLSFFGRLNLSLELLDFSVGAFVVAHEFVELWVARTMLDMKGHRNRVERVLTERTVHVRKIIE